MTQTLAVVGIDVSKARLDAHALTGQVRQVANTAAGHRELIAWIQAVGGGVAVMEASGGYEKALAGALRRAGVEAHVVDPKRVRHYAKAMGQLAKTDRIDARVISEYGAAVIAAGRLPVPAPDDPVRDRLAGLVAARADLVAHRDAVQQQSGAAAPGPARQALQRVHACLKREIAELERRMTALIADHPLLADLARRLDTVPGLGPVAIAAILAWLPELGLVSRRRLAALVGVAPVADDSGTVEGQRRIAGGRKRLRNILYMASLSARTWNPVLKRHYEQLLARGKPGKVALIACLRKLLVILTAMVVRRQDWTPPQTAAAA
jgi:transposase